MMLVQRRPLRGLGIVDGTGTFIAGGFLGALIFGIGGLVLGSIFGYWIANYKGDGLHGHRKRKR